MEKKPSPSTPSLKWSVLFFLCILVLWQLLLPVLEIPSYLLPTPLAILAEFQKRGGFIFASFLPTFYETILGFLIGALIGVVSGLGIVYSRILWLTIYPSLVVIGSIPRIAIAPLILIWLALTAFGPKSQSPFSSPFSRWLSILSWDFL